MGNAVLKIRPATVVAAVVIAGTGACVQVLGIDGDYSDVPASDGGGAGGSGATASAGSAGSFNDPSRCGWNPQSDSYTCGFVGADPAGTVLACPATLVEGAQCSPLMDDCCEGNDVNWRCESGVLVRQDCAEVADSGASAGVVACGSDFCGPPEQHCCHEGGWGSRDYCLSEGESCQGTPIYCDEASDCPSGNVCCAKWSNNAFSVVDCQANCDGFTLCDPNGADTCGPGEKCSPSFTLDGYNLCK